MKRQERHHLKENELAHSLRVAREYVEPRGRQFSIGLGALAVIAILVLGVIFVRQRSSKDAEQLLAEALVALNARVIPSSDAGEGGELPASAQLGATGTFSTEEAKLKVAVPKLKAAADAHPDTQAGITARYHLAGALSALGRNEEAVKEFGDVARRAGPDTFYGRMALLGQADTQSRAGQLDSSCGRSGRSIRRRDQPIWRVLQVTASKSTPSSLISVQTRTSTTCSPPLGDRFTAQLSWPLPGAILVRECLVSATPSALMKSTWTRPRQVRRGRTPASCSWTSWVSLPIPRRLRDGGVRLLVVPVSRRSDYMTLGTRRRPCCYALACP
jgi:hypothetical protein